MTADQAPAAPPIRRVVWRLTWCSAIGGLIVATGLASTGVVAAGGGADLFASLVPAVISIGLGMAVPPVLGALLGLAIVSRPPRRLRREQWATAIGGTVGAFVSPVLFYPASAMLGTVVALIIAAAVAVGYPLTLRSLWSRVGVSG